MGVSRHQEEEKQHYRLISTKHFIIMCSSVLMQLLVVALASSFSTAMVQYGRSRPQHQPSYPQHQPNEQSYCVPTYHTQTEYVTKYQPQYKSVYITKYNTVTRPQYHTAYLTNTVYETKYQPHYRTLYSTYQKIVTSPVYHTQYHIRTEYRTTYTTQTEHVPQYHTVTYTESCYENEQPSYLTKESGYGK